MRRSRPTAGIDWVVAGARPAASLAERLQWLAHAIAWVRGEGAADEGGAAATPAVRIRFLLQVLDRNPARRLEVATVLRRTLAELDATSLLCEAGLPRAHAFFQELGARIAAKVLPDPPAEAELASVVARAFPREEDAHWVAALPDEALQGLARLLAEDGGDDAVDPLAAMRRDAADAILVLASQVQAIGLASRVRRRRAEGPLRDSPFAALDAHARAFVEARPGSEPQRRAQELLARSIEHCRDALADIRRDLAREGVSTDLVYSLERSRLSLSRIERLVGLQAASSLAPRDVADLAASLIRAGLRQRSVMHLLRMNSRLLARRMVESARRTGEHYITRDAAEYRAMLASAALGGAITGGTVIVKLAVTDHGLPLAIEGFVASVNYALSFVAIHMLHGTLATKQPAMTAATMAEGLNAARHRGRLTEFVDDVANLTRSQIAAIAGNLMLVAPVALLLHGVLLLATGTSLPARGDALHYVESLSILGPTPLYAAYTGVLLWLSALAAGWFENWAAYRRLPEAIAASPALTAWLGAKRAERFASAIRDNVAALGGNVSLGVLLGTTPVVAAFFGLPLEVRHVTLSTGQLAVAAAAHGMAIFREPAFWLAVAGIAVIGVLNLTVSFVLALTTAVRSTGVSAPSRRRLRRALLSRLVRHPRAFLLPPRTTAARPGTSSAD